MSVTDTPPHLEGSSVDGIPPSCDEAAAAAAAVEVMVAADAGQTMGDDSMLTDMACSQDTADGLEPQQETLQDSPSDNTTPDDNIDPVRDDSPEDADDPVTDAVEVSPAEEAEEEPTGVSEELGVINGLTCVAEDITTAMDRALEKTGPIIIVIIQEEAEEAAEEGENQEDGADGWVQDITCKVEHHHGWGALCILGPPQYKDCLSQVLGFPW